MDGNKRPKHRRGLGPCSRSVACLLLGLLPAPAAWAQSGRLLFVDQDAHSLSADRAGALYSLDPADPEDSWPDVELAADINAPALEFIDRVVVSPSDGRIFFTDRRVLPTEPSRVHVGACGSAEVGLLLEDPELPGPFDLATLPDGRLVLSDLHADPSGLGTDSTGEGGHGALFWLDPGNGATLLLSDGTDHPGYPGVRQGDSIFEDPIAVVHDPLTDFLYVADRSADPLGEDYFGAVFRVDPDDGSVELVASDWDFISLVAIGLRADGRVLVIDSLLNDSIVWEIDPSDNDPEANHSELTSGEQHAYLEDIVVDADGTIYLSDSGHFDTSDGTWLKEPMILRLDESVALPDANKVTVNRSLALITPVGLAVNPGCPEPSEGLAVSLAVESGGPSLPEQFDAACLSPGWTLCPSYVIARAALDMTWLGHVRPGFDDRRRLWLYEHGLPAADLRFLSRSGDFLVSAP